MSRLNFEVTSSRSGEVYQLSAYRTPAGIRFSCSCAAGESGSFCKHRLDLLRLEASASAHNPDIKELHLLFADSSASRLLVEIQRLEDQAETIKTKIKARKRELSIALMG